MTMMKEQAIILISFISIICLFTLYISSSHFLYKSKINNEERQLLAHYDNTGGELLSWQGFYYDPRKDMKKPNYIAYLDIPYNDQQSDFLYILMRYSTDRSNMNVQMAKYQEDGQQMKSTSELLTTIVGSQNLEQSIEEINVLYMSCHFKSCPNIRGSEDRIWFVILRDPLEYAVEQFYRMQNERIVRDNILSAKSFRFEEQGEYSKEHREHMRIYSSNTNELITSNRNFIASELIYSLKPQYKWLGNSANEANSVLRQNSFLIGVYSEIEEFLVAVRNRMGWNIRQLIYFSGVSNFIHPTVNEWPEDFLLKLNQTAEVKEDWSLFEYANTIKSEQISRLKNFDEELSRLKLILATLRSLCSNVDRDHKAQCMLREYDLCIWKHTNDKTKCVWI